MDTNRFRHAKKHSTNVRFSITIDEKVIEELTTYCDENSYVRPKLIEIILEEFLDRYEHKDEKKE
jgi:metal-responsive CopG/Arc/MetJ family transcriptional regulator